MGLKKSTTNCVDLIEIDIWLISLSAYLIYLKKSAPVEYYKKITPVETGALMHHEKTKKSNTISLLRQVAAHFA